MTLRPRGNGRVCNKSLLSHGNCKSTSLVVGTVKVYTDTGLWRKTHLDSQKHTSVSLNKDGFLTSVAVKTEQQFPVSSGRKYL